MRRETLNPPCIALITDFGQLDWFAGAMHAEIFRRAPAARVIDLTHGVPPQQIVAGAFALEAILPSLPPGCIVCAVVDPGVGAARRAMCGWIGDYGWSGPDNGLATPLLELAGSGSPELYAIEREPWRKPNPSATFHGRDLFAPAAAMLALGEDPSDAGRPIAQPQRLSSAQPREIAPSRWEGRIVWVDRFGNCITNFLESEFRQKVRGGFRIQAGNIGVTQLETTFSSVPEGEPVAYWGSAGRLELAINCGSAANATGLGVGHPITLQLSL